MDQAHVRMALLAVLAVSFAALSLPLAAAKVPIPGPTGALHPQKCALTRFLLLQS